MGLRNTSLSPAAGNPLVFGLLHDGCVIQHAHNALNGSSMVSILSPPPFANGYYLSIAAGGQTARDPVRWLVEAQANGSDAWRAVGASVWRGQGSLAAYFPNLEYPTPEAEPGGRVHVAVDGRPSWPWMLTGMITYAAAGCGLTTSIIFALMRQNWAVVWIVSGVFGSNSLLQLAASAGFYAQGSWRSSAVSCVYFTGNAVMTIMLLINERLILSAMLLFSIFFTLALVRCYFSPAGLYCFSHAAKCNLTTQTPAPSAFMLPGCSTHGCVTSSTCLQVVRHAIVYEDLDGLLGAALRSSGVITFLFTSGLITFHRWVCFQIILAHVYTVDHIIITP